MPQVVSDLIVTPCRVLYAPVGTSVPADTVAAGGTWTNWTEVGWTGGAVEVTYEYEMVERGVEQSLGKLRRFKSSHSLKIKAMLAEFYLDGVQLGTGGTVSDTAAGVSQPGKESLAVGDVYTVDERAWGFEGSYVDEDGATFPVRLFVWKATAMLSEAIKFGKEEETLINLEIDALSDMTQSAANRLFRLDKILEPAS